MGWRQKSKGKNRSIKDEVFKRLSTMFRNGKGVSRHENDDNSIHSDSTYRTYKKQCYRFADYARETGCKTLDEARDVVDEYLIMCMERGDSPASVKTYAAALAKLYGCSITDFVKIPSRKRENIKRSRYEVAYDKHISEKTEKALAKFTECIGCRSSSLKKMTGNDLVDDGKGRYGVRLHEKGGKDRIAIIYHPDPAIMEEVISAFKKAGSAHVIPHVHAAYDNHFYRGVYAKNLYEHIARPIEMIPPSERYHYRGDMKGVILDKRAMRYVSKMMGHNRIDVIASNYLY